MLTNRGRIYPEIVINAAGVFAEDVAEMAGDRFYSIHPRREPMPFWIKGRKTYGRIASWKTLKKLPVIQKGGGIVHTAHDNLLVGPDAVETYEKENFATQASSIENNFKSSRVLLKNCPREISLHISPGVRAPTFEEDFVIERAENKESDPLCRNSVPGLTTAPAVAKDVAKMAAKMVSVSHPVKEK